MHIRDAVKTNSKMFIFDEDPDEMGFISNGKWCCAWGFNFSEQSITGRHDLQLNLDLEPKFHQVSELNFWAYRDLIMMIFNPNTYIER